MKTIHELYEYRTMIGSMIRRDLRGRYKGSALGFAWTFLNPLLQLAVYTLVFSMIMRAGIKDVKKIYFPREVLPISHVTCQLVNMLLSMVVVLAVLLLSGKGISFKAILYLPPVIVAEYLLALSITMIVSAVTVYLRDLEHVLVIITMAWQFLTPVMYSIDMVPEQIQTIFHLNPMTPIIIAYRDILYYQKAPKLGTLTQGIIFSIILLIVGWNVFGHLKKHFAEEM